MVSKTKDNPKYVVQTYYIKQQGVDIVWSRFPRKLQHKIISGLNPLWRKQIRTHGNATTAIDGTFQIMEAYPCYFWVTGKTAPGNPLYPANYTDRIAGQLAGWGVGFDTGDGGGLAEAQALAYMRFNKKCQSELRALEGGVLLGELRETLHMLRRPAAALLGKLDKYITHVSKRNRGNGNKSSAKKVIADTWLESSFGWKPFFNDIEDARKLLQRIGQSEKTVKISAGAQVIKQLSKPVSGIGAGPGGIKYTESQRYFASSHVRIKGEILVRAVTNQATILEQAGLTFDQFVPTVWELLPWSFLIDYFTNIGDILSYRNSVYSNLAWSCVGSKVDNVEEYFVSPNQSATKASMGNTYVSSGGSPGATRLITRTINRGVDNSLGNFSPSLQFNVDLSDTQMLNCAALLASANRFHPQSVRR